MISTGNELQDPKLSLEFGKIRDSNKITLLTLFKQYGYQTEDFGLVKDEYVNFYIKIFEVRNYIHLSFNF